MTRIASFISILLSVGFLAFGFANAGFVPLGVFILVVGVMWIYAQWREYEWSSMAGMGLAVVVAASGIMMGGTPGWMFAGVLCSLLAWDLAGYKNRLRFASKENDISAMEKKHLSRLGILVVVAAAIFLLVSFIHLQIGLWWLILLAFVTALGLVQLLWRLR